MSGLTWLSTTFTIDEKEVQEGKCTAIMYLAATAMTVSRDKDALPQKSGCVQLFEVLIMLVISSYTGSIFSKFVFPGQMGKVMGMR